MSESPSTRPPPAARLRWRAASQLGLFTRAQAQLLGCSDAMLRTLRRRGEIEALARGVYRFVAVPTSFEQETLAACLATHGAVASGVTAMRLYGFDPGKSVLDEHPGPDVTTKMSRHQPKDRSRVVHSARRLSSAETTKRNGIPVTAPVPTLLDAASLVPPETLDRFLGHLVATKALFPGRLRHLATELKSDPSTFSRPGSGALAGALERAGISTAPDSVLEHRTLLLLRQAGLPEPEPQWRVHDGRQLLAIVDFAWPAKQIALEVDGFRWHSDPASFATDRRRANRLQELGWAVYRTTFQQLEDGAGELLRQLSGALRGHAAPSTSRLRATPYLHGTRITRRLRLPQAGADRDLSRIA
ncbi:MAG: type IV toxin-antitoxin system AbiEi family antitoxin domain-containing protein [Acidimicrobiales bacterium]